MLCLLAVGVADGETAREILNKAGVQGGLVVHLGCGDGKLTAGFGEAGNYLVHGLAMHPGQIVRARETIRSLGYYGTVSVDLQEGPVLPYADNLVNLLVADGLGQVSEEECLRVLAPKGVLYRKVNGAWEKTVRPWPAEIDEWTHHLHDAGGNPVANDTMVGPPRHLQWTAGPLWARSHGWTPSVSAMISGGGRFFYICDETLNGAGDVLPSKWSLIARDAFNGVLLWKRPMSRWGSLEISGTPDTGGGTSVGRFTMPPHAGKRLVAAGDRLFVTLGAEAPVTALDAATGMVDRVYSGTERADEFVVHEGRLIVTMNPPRDRRPAVVDRDQPPPAALGKHICAVDPETGDVLWKAGPFQGIRAGRSQDPFGRLELAAGDGIVFVLTSQSIEACSLHTGQRVWSVARPALPRGAVRRLGFSGMYEFQLSVLVYHDGVILLAQPEPNTHHTYHTMPGTLYAFDAENGQAMWKHAYGGWGHCTPPDVFAIGGTVWSHVNAETEFGSVWGNGYRALDSSKVDYRIQALDLKTGSLRCEFPTKDIFNVGHHHRCYRNKITERFLMSSRRGVEFVDLASGENYQNHWLRSGCKVGYLPCNGLLYVAPHPCGCYINAKLTGFNALSSTTQGPVLTTDGESKLEKGPAYAQVPGAATPKSSTADWPTYRHDPRRSGATESPVDTKLDVIWRTAVAARPSGLVVGQGVVLGAAVDAHTVFALDAEEGDRRWSYTAGGRVSAPPTLHEGMALFGSVDGCVYCLRISDGALVWKFRGAPQRRLLNAFGQLESAWPVPGVLVQDGICWFAAGRSSYLDGGMFLYALDPATGKVLKEKNLYSPDPETGKMSTEPSAQTMPGLLNDVPGSDGRCVFIRQMNVSSESPGGEHLFTTGGYLDSTWFNRTFWKIGRAQTTGLMVLGDKVAFGVEPFTSRSRDVLFQPGTEAYRLRCLSLQDSADDKAIRRGRTNRKRAGSRGASIVWEQRLDIRVTSMVRAAETVFVAGPPDVVPPEDPHAAWEGRAGGLLARFACRDGARDDSVQLPAPPVWDGMAAAGGRLFLALDNGNVVCLGDPE
jgi:outer membrane protein assembly factor BamB